LLPLGFFGNEVEVPVLASRRVLVSHSDLDPWRGTQQEHRDALPHHFN
jgi:hypothetical protein